MLPCRPRAWRRMSSSSISPSSRAWRSLVPGRVKPSALTAPAAGGGAGAQPVRPVGAGLHLAQPERVEHRLGLIVRHALDHAGAATAGQQREHQPGLFRRAAVHARAHAQRAVPAAHHRWAMLGSVELQVTPDIAVQQRTEIARALAAVAARRGAEVVLVSGPVTLEPPGGVKVVLPP